MEQSNIELLYDFSELEKNVSKFIDEECGEISKNIKSRKTIFPITATIVLVMQLVFIIQNFQKINALIINNLEISNVQFIRPVSTFILFLFILLFLGEVPRLLGKYIKKGKTLLLLSFRVFILQPLFIAIPIFYSFQEMSDIALIYQILFSIVFTLTITLYFFLTIFIIIRTLLKDISLDIVILLFVFSSRKNERNFWDIPTYSEFLNKMILKIKMQKNFEINNNLEKIEELSRNRINNLTNQNQTFSFILTGLSILGLISIIGPNFFDYVAKKISTIFNDTLSISNNSGDVITFLAISFLILIFIVAYKYYSNSFKQQIANEIIQVLSFTEKKTKKKCFSISSILDFLFF